MKRSKGTSAGSSGSLSVSSSSKWLQVLFGFWDLLLTLLPLIFLGLAFSALAVHGEEFLAPGESIAFAATLGPTLYPIVFAAVFGRFTKWYALYRASKGEKLGLLEQLVGSHTLFGAVEKAWLIHTLSIVTLVIPLAWTLSPLGGQSSLRVLTREDAQVVQSVPIIYYNDTYWSGTLYASAATSKSSGFDRLYSSCLFQSNLTRRSSEDNWGNVKIPIMDTLAEFSPNSAVDLWTKVSPSRDIQFSSLAGIMFDKTSLNGNSTFDFDMRASYLRLNCSELSSTRSYEELLTRLGPLVKPPGLGSNRTFSTTIPGDTPMFSLGGIDTSLGFNHFFIGEPSEFPMNESEILTIKFAARAYESDSTNMIFYHSECSVTMPEVEAYVECQGMQPCFVSRMRPLQRKSINMTPFNDPLALGHAVVGGALQKFLDHMLWASGQVSITTRSATEWYILAGEPRADVRSSIGGGIEYATLDKDALSLRLGTLMTTLWKLSVAKKDVYTQRATDPRKCDTSDMFNMSSCFSDGYFPAETLVTRTDTIRVWRAHKVWIGLTVAVSLATFFFGLLGLFLKYTVHAPDILGYVSTMTRDNPHFDGAQGGQHLDGDERARQLRNERVQLLNVADADTGQVHIVLASCQGGE